MSVHALALRPAVDTRPPAQPWTGAGASDPVPSNQPALRLVEDTVPGPITAPPRPTKVPVAVDVVPSGAGPGASSDLVDQARTWAPWFAQLLAEALDGRRPLDALSRWLDDWVLAEVSRRVRLVRRMRMSGSRLPPAAVVSLRAQFTHPRVLEVAVHAHRGRRSAAWAFQLVRSGDRWRCTALVVDPLPADPRSH